MITNFNSKEPFIPVSVPQLVQSPEVGSLNLFNGPKLDLDQFKDFDTDLGLLGNVWKSLFPKTKKEDDLLYNKQLADQDPNETRSIKDIVEASGFDFEKHTVKTEDGYILEVHRVNLKTESNSIKPVVFLQHGILSSSETWVLNG